MRTLKHHPAYQLREDAADKFDAYEDKYGVLNVTSAGRTPAQQQHLIDLWDKGGAANRPPYLYPPARPALASNHVKDGGIAVDTSDYNKFAQHSAEFGFVHSYPGNDPVHFDFVGNGSNSAAAGFNQTVQNEQAWMISQGISVGASGADGIRGAGTIAGIKKYQELLRAYGYTGLIDGDWGGGTQTAHEKYYAAKHAAAPVPATPGNPFGIGDVRGLQKVAKLNGGNTSPDNSWGAGSKDGFANFLRKSWGYVGNDELGPQMWAAIARWLRARWGYVGNDVPGPNMRAALSRANAANFSQL